MYLVISCSIFNRYTYWYCVYFIMFSFIILGLTCLLTIYGVLFESGGALGVCFFFYILCFILNFIGAIIICIFGVEESPVLIKELNEVFLGLIYRMDYDDRASRILKIVQEYVRKLILNLWLSSNNFLSLQTIELKSPVTFQYLRYDAVELMDQMITSMHTNQCHGSAEIESLVLNIRMAVGNLSPGTSSRGVHV